MSGVKLVRASGEYGARVMDYRREFVERGENAYGGAGLTGYESFDEWLASVNANSREETVAPGRVPSDTLLAIRESDGRLVGMVSIRHRLNEQLLKYAGHIGYSVRASERRKGYATAMLAMALDRLREMGLTRALVTCDADNVGSAKAIRNNGGVFENSVDENGVSVQRYWIEL